MKIKLEIPFKHDEFWDKEFEMGNDYEGIFQVVIIDSENKSTKLCQFIWDGVQMEGIKNFKLLAIVSES